MILNPRQVKAFQEALAGSNALLVHVEYLEKLAAVYPAIRERVADVRTKREFIRTFAEAAIDSDRMLSE